MQGQLISINGYDSNEVMARISQLKNEIKNELNDSWGEKISNLFVQLTSFSEQIIQGYEEHKIQI